MKTIVHLLTAATLLSMCFFVSSCTPEFTTSILVLESGTWEILAEGSLRQSEFTAHSLIFLDGGASGHMACNSIGSDYTANDNGDLEFHDGWWTTYVGCGTELQEWSNNVFGLLDQVDTYKISGETLYLLNEDQTVDLRYRLREE